MNTLPSGINTGFLGAEPRSTDFKAGGVTKIVPEIRNFSADWTQYLPTNETQISTYFDTMACVSFSALNCIEAQVNFLISTGAINGIKLQLIKDLGFIDENGKFGCSDRFTAKISGTTHEGNYLVNVWDSIRRDGLLPETDWNYPRDQRLPVFDWDDYYKEIPQEIKDKAKRILDILDIKYEWLPTDQPNWTEWLQLAPVQVATAVCPPWNTDKVIAGCFLSVGHATMLYNKTEEFFNIFDTYIPYNKKFASNYPIPHAIRGVVSLKVMPIDPLFGKKFAGKLLLAVEDRGAVWYVTPEGKRVKIGIKSEEVEGFLQAIRDKKVGTVGMTNENLGKIDMV